MSLGVWILYVTETTIIAVSKVTAIQLIILLLLGMLEVCKKLVKIG